MFERIEMICYMLGWIEGTKNPIRRTDALILLDQTLLKFNQPIMTKDEKDALEYLSAEQSFALLSAGFSGKKVKDIARTGKI